MSFLLQNICLDHLNLRLASYELDTEAFAAFRSRQLQAPKALICDPIRGQLEDKDEEEQEKNTSLCLEDLHLVSGFSLLLFKCCCNDYFIYHY